MHTVASVCKSTSERMDTSTYVFAQKGENNITANGSLVRIEAMSRATVFQYAYVWIAVRTRARTI